MSYRNLSVRHYHVCSSVKSVKIYSSASGLRPWCGKQQNWVLISQDHFKKLLCTLTHMIITWEAAKLIYFNSNLFQQQNIQTWDRFRFLDNDVNSLGWIRWRLVPWQCSRWRRHVRGRFVGPLFSDVFLEWLAMALIASRLGRVLTTSLPCNSTFESTAENPTPLTRRQQNVVFALCCLA